MSLKYWNCASRTATPLAGLIHNGSSVHYEAWGDERDDPDIENTYGEDVISRA